MLLSLLFIGCNESNTTVVTGPDGSVGYKYKIKNMRNKKVFDVVIVDDMIYITNKRNKRTRTFRILQ